ncbi:MAG TPA: hypothetical protein VKQ28_11575 [Candidatus Acidoferrum sp.]|nr:hypothetical protein [Candidatus Acidoferrum sp.]
MGRIMLHLGLLLVAVAVLAAPANGQLSGAIFTTVADGSEVNFNIYSAKTDVYLDGGPGPGAPQGAAGLPDGVYVFMVTDPSGKTLLSTDIAACRRFQVSSGIITALVLSNPACAAAHLTGVDVDHGAVTVQLMPYNDTPNNGGEYKVWATPVGNYTCALTVVDCGNNTHGFINSSSKTDNYKVKVSTVREIDTRFHDTNNNGALIDGMMVTWIDTNGASNNKWSYYNQALDVNHEAHVEAPENGTHQIVIANQVGCTVDDVYLAGQKLPNLGPQTVAVKISPSYKNITIFVDVNCN